jgi:hypothetical protein
MALVKTEKRLFLSLVASIVIAALLLAATYVTKSKVLFLLQMPGYLVCALLWGVHSSALLQPGLSGLERTRLFTGRFFLEQAV